MRTIALVVAMGLVIGVAFVSLTGGEEESPPLQDAILADVVSAECVGDCAVRPQPTAIPCLTCNQDATAWTRFTTKAPPDLGAHAVALIEGSCGKLIYGLQPVQPRAPASLTKIVTAMVVADSAKLDDNVNINVTGWDLVVENDSSIMGLEKGMRMSVEDLLYGLLLASGNDAALALADHLGGEAKLVEKMNQHVQKLGLKDTVLRNTHGLDAPGAQTTPLDMAFLGRQLLTYPDLAKIVDTPYRPFEWHDGGGIWNGNYLTYTYKDSIGIKTGYTEEAGWLIVSAAQRDGRVLIASVFDSFDVIYDSMRLFDWAYANVPSVC
jgi:D-alanyl-D-alanine carboxypeptidase